MSEAQQLKIMLSLYTRVAQKVMPHTFFSSEAIYSECMKFTHSITGCFLYTF
jgi:hypothetical protein